MKLTKWYSGDQKPVRVGVYERQYPCGDWCYSYFDGTEWFCGINKQNHKSKVLDQFAVDQAVVEFRSGFLSFIQSLPWRGIAKCK